MKAILVIDMPEDCGQCPFMKSVDVVPTNYFYCTADSHNLKSLSERFEGREEWCPLKPMPEYEVNNDPENEYHKRWVNGYNAFLRYLKGEEE